MDTLTVVHLETFEVSPMLQEVGSTITPLVAKNGNRLEVRCAEGLGALQADLTKVRQALFNLLSNACKLVRDCFLAFRSTLPRRERRSALGGWQPRGVVSIHATAKGATMAAVMREFREVRHSAFAKFCYYSKLLLKRGHATVPWGYHDDFRRAGACFRSETRA
jgi:signal transduction histidine kinase